MNTQTWRDLVDLLTPEQVAQLEYCEREKIPPGMADPEHHLNCAHMMVRHNFIQRLCADVAPPADAIGELGEGNEWDDGYGRVYTVADRVVGAMSVKILGVQFDDGRTERSILAGDIEEMTGEEARQLAQVLIAAADELEGSTR